MDTDLQNLVDHLEKHHLTVATCDPERRLQVTNPISTLLSEEIVLKRGRYYTGFDYEIGERGKEEACADRIAYLLGATTEAAS
ncbi:hypothetical protein [Streptomyces sp. NBC_00356]|uniref:hypothetical protein n=1 Tax=Streptomyces sp. NBC_00356 TaxID=2975724 RepID=UPI002E260A4E